MTTIELLKDRKRQCRAGLSLRRSVRTRGQSSGRVRCNRFRDGKMRRRIRREYTWSGSVWSLQSETRYVYDGNVVIQERDGNNVPLVSYTRGNDLSGSLKGAGGIGGLLARSDNQMMVTGDANAHAYYHADGNGNITRMINASQTTVAKYIYDPFGTILAQSGSLADANLYRFSSKELHPNSGLVYYLYRYYDSNLQRWLNRDPLEEEGGLDMYTFVYNDPIDYFDDFGEKATTKHPKKPTIPKDPKTPGDDRSDREQYAKDIMAQFAAWKKANPCCDVDPCTLTAQWMYESDWGRSTGGRGNNLGGIKHDDIINKYPNLSDFYKDYTGNICNDKRYKNAPGKKGEDYLKKLKADGYDQTDGNYVNAVMKIYKQIGCK